MKRFWLFIFFNYKIVGIKGISFLNNVFITINKMMRELYDFLSEKKYWERVKIKPYWNWLEVDVRPNINTKWKIEISWTLWEDGFTIDQIIKSISAILEKKVYD